MLAFFTVGSTRFDALVQAAVSQPVIDALRERGYNQVVVQCGNSDFEFSSSIAQNEAGFSVERGGVTVELWKFKPGLQQEYERADLVISHAGSGTILDVLRIPKPLIVVPNPTLLDNHQEELSEALSKLNHLRSCRVDDLAQTIASFDPKSLTPFPAFDGSKFASILDEEMGRGL